MFTSLSLGCPTAVYQFHSESRAESENLIILQLEEASDIGFFIHTFLVKKFIVYERLEYDAGRTLKETRRFHRHEGGEGELKEIRS